MGTHPCAMRASQQTDESTHTLHAAQLPLKEQFSHGWRFRPCSKDEALLGFTTL